MSADDAADQSPATTTSESDDTADIAMKVADGIAWITLDRPEKRNAVTYEMWLSLADFCATACLLYTSPSPRD